MQRWGQTAAGTRRYRCRFCEQTGVRTRPDNRIRYRRRLFLAWSMGKSTLSDLARTVRVTRQTLTGWFRPFWSRPPGVTPIAGTMIAVLDGTSLVWRRAEALIAYDPSTARPLGWAVADHERYESWLLLLANLRHRGFIPAFVVCDGQRGLLAAVRSVWPQALIQRCVIHVHRQSRLWLTQEPKTRAGQELLAIVNQLLAVRTLRQKRRWVRSFRRWQRRHDHFLKERSWNLEGTRWWYTHRKPRAVRSLLRNSIPDLFRYVRFPDVPRTTNHVEGGINSRLKELLRSHRGMRLSRRVAMTRWFLSVRQH